VGVGKEVGKGDGGSVLSEGESGEAVNEEKSACSEM
jgi:hypothetical protein